MTYKVETIQYGEYRDVFEHSTLKDLQGDLLNCALLSSIEVVELYENDEPMNRTRKRVLLSIARHEARSCLGSYIRRKKSV